MMLLYMCFKKFFALELEATGFILFFHVFLLWMCVKLKCTRTWNSARKTLKAHLFHNLRFTLVFQSSQYSFFPTRRLTRKETDKPKYFVGFGCLKHLDFWRMDVWIEYLEKKVLSAFCFIYAIALLFVVKWNNILFMSVMWHKNFFLVQAAKQHQSSLLWLKYSSSSWYV